MKKDAGHAVRLSGLAERYSSSRGSGRKTIRLTSAADPPPRRIAVWKPSAPRSPASSALAQRVERREVVLGDLVARGP